MNFIGFNDLPATGAVISWLYKRRLFDSIEFLHKNGLDIGLSEGEVAFRLKNGEIIKDGSPGTKESYLKVNDAKAFYICEDLTDALTSLELGMNAISLNGLKNLNRFLDVFERNVKAHDYVYVLAFHRNEVSASLMEDVKNVMMSMNTVGMRWVNLFLLSDEEPTLSQWYIKNYKK